MEWDMLPAGVGKRILSGGSGDLPNFPDGSKVWFNFRTYVIKDDDERQLLDDSRQSKHPFELLIGKKFKLDVWETLIKTMRVNEVAEFVCETTHVGSYPIVSKSLRGMWNKENHKHDHNHEHEHQHQCGFSALSQGLGYPDLDEYVNNPAPLAFQFELIKLELPGEYEKDVWSLSLDEKLSMIPEWKEEGNMYYKKGDYESACKKYSEALGSLEQLTTREKPGTEEWLALEKMKVPLLLNYSQCMLSTKEYYKAIEHLSAVLEKDPVNVKGYYRRAKAYHSVFSYKEAREDYEKTKELDSTLSNTIYKELKRIELDELKKDLEDKEKYKKAFT